MLFHRKINDVSLANDIKYHAPLSYRHLRIVGWLMMVLAQLAIVLQAAANALPSTHYDITLLNNLSNFFSIMGSLAISMFLLANFAIILNSQKGIIRLVKTHIILAILIYLVYLLIFGRYLFGIAGKLDPTSGRQKVEQFIYSFFSSNLTFNVFVDLLVCSSFYLFVNYEPRKIFTGKKIYIFRALSIIPLAYEIASIILKGLSLGSGIIELPILVLPLFATKPNLMFLAFIVITIFMKLRKKIYFKKGGNEEKYNEFLKTNYNATSFAIFVSVIFFIAGCLDLLCSFIFMNIFYELNPTLDYTLSANMKLMMRFASGWGFGKASSMALFSPLILLFSYTKTHSVKSEKWDIIIPVIGIVLIIFTYLEGYFQILMNT